MNLPLDYDEPIRIAEGVYWVSPRRPGKILYCNSYLVQLDGPSGRTMNLLIDPGGTAEFSDVSAKVIKVVGDLQKINIVSINHQDPDVCGSLPLLANRFAPQSLMLMTEDTWRLVALTGIPRERVRFVEKYGGKMSFPQISRHLEIIPSPYCHFTGAFLIFEPKSGCLFTGDLFAGVSLDQAMYPLHADEHNWSGIRFFHERYMPCNVALRWIVRKIRQLQGVKMICPQHGSIIPESLIPEFLDRMESLLVGADLLADRELDTGTREAWNHLANAVLKTATELFGQSATGKIAGNKTLMQLGHFDGNHLTIDKLPQQFVETLVLALTDKEPPELANRIVMKALVEAENLHLGTFSVNLAIEEPGPALPGAANDSDVLPIDLDDTAVVIEALL